MTNQKPRVDRRGFLQASAAAGLATIASGVSGSVQAQASPDPGVLDQPAGTPLRMRRVVTGHRADGQSFVAIDEVLNNESSAREGMQASVIWSTGESPADNMDTQDGAARTLATSDDNGTVFRIVKYDPGVAPRNHRTQSVDYAVIMSGEITMGLDEGEVTLRQGDVLVQRGTIHNWVNNGSVPCLVAFILCAAKPLEVGGKTYESTG
jgi:mannose-6-phosphate isomerase-like protein (cupin superfamily)